MTDRNALAVDHTKLAISRAIRAAIERHCHCDTRWPATARIDDMHMDAFITEMQATLRQPPSDVSPRARDHETVASIICDAFNGGKSFDEAADAILALSPAPAAAPNWHYDYLKKEILRKGGGVDEEDGSVWWPDEHPERFAAPSAAAPTLDADKIIEQGKRWGHLTIEQVYDLLDANAASIAALTAPDKGVTYETCHACGGSGLMLGGAGEPTECRTCKGNTVVRSAPDQSGPDENTREDADNLPRCNCGHLFELCPQADCNNIYPLDLPDARSVAEMKK